MRRRWIVGLVALFAIGVGLGLLGGLYVFDEESDDGRVENSDGATSEPVDCDEANAFIEEANAAMVTINEAEQQDLSFFAALIVEQRAITFAMDAAPSCFSLNERARAHGLLDGIRLLSNAPVGSTES